MKPVVEWESLRAFDDFTHWDIRLHGTGPDGEPFEKTLKFDVPVDVEEISRIVAQFNSGELLP